MVQKTLDWQTHSAAPNHRNDLNPERSDPIFSRKHSSLWWGTNNTLSWVYRGSQLCIRFPDSHAAAQSLSWRCYTRKLSQLACFVNNHNNNNNNSSVCVTHICANKQHKFCPIQMISETSTRSEHWLYFYPLQGLKLSEEDSPGCFGKSVFFHAHVCTYTFFFDCSEDFFQTRQRHLSTVIPVHHPSNLLLAGLGYNTKNNNNKNKKTPLLHGPKPVYQASNKQQTSQTPPHHSIWWNKSSFWYWTTK